MTTTAIEQIEGYLAGFTEFEKTASGQNLPWLRSLREDAFALFCKTGFPTTHDEDWRFTNVSSIANAKFRLAEKKEPELSRDDLRAWRAPGVAAQLVFIDGQYSERLSQVFAKTDGITVQSLQRQIEENPATVEPYLGKYLNIERDPFAALNSAFMEEGAYIHLQRGKVLEAPIALLFLSTVRDRPTMTHLRNLIIAEDATQVTVIEDYASIGNVGGVFSNAVTELIAGDSAVVEHYLIEREDRQANNFSTLRVQQGRNANVSSHSLLLGGGLVRNNVHPVLAGEGSECLINGLFVGNGKQHLDNYMHVEHASPHCSSRQFYNGILDDQSHGVFHGRILVHQVAQKTDAKQTNRNLLLNDDAQIDTKPQLEIYADDVKCTHGATIGQIEENALFYLQSRGISEVESRKLLLMAFAGECLDRMKEGPARKLAESLLQKQLESMAKAKEGK